MTTHPVGEADGFRTDACVECGSGTRDGLDWSDDEIDEIKAAIEWRERPVDGLFTAEDIAAIAANAARARGEAV